MVLRRKSESGVNIYFLDLFVFLSTINGYGYTGSDWFSPSSTDRLMGLGPLLEGPAGRSNGTMAAVTRCVLAACRHLHSSWTCRQPAFESVLVVILGML
jgi:hypothetical protein